MKQTIQIKKTRLGEGRPKICVCIAGIDENAIIHQVTHLPMSQFDLIEWRADHFNYLNDLHQIRTVLKHFRTQLPEIPVLFTCRTRSEGGMCTLTQSEYLSLLKDIIDTQEIDMIDLELNTFWPYLQILTSLAQKKGIVVISSYHNFEGIPCEAQLLQYLDNMQKHGADIAKIAVTPKTSADLITLLRLAYVDPCRPKSIPLILIGMGELGKITRVGCDLFRSPFTFCAGQTYTAPGQLSAATLYPIFTALDPLNLSEFG